MCNASTLTRSLVAKKIKEKVIPVCLTVNRLKDDKVLSRRRFTCSANILFSALTILLSLSPQNTC